jgi:hypothetical protein
MRYAILMLSLLLGGCGTLGKLDASAERKREIADFQRVVIGDFTANDQREPKNAEQAAERAAEIEVGRKAFAARIAQELREIDAFEEVMEGEGAGPALRISGSIDQWEPGNLAARSLVGFVGKSEFEASVIFSDLDSGTELGRLQVNRNSWPLPIGTWTNVVQSVEFHMGMAAKRIAHELAKAKGIQVAEPEGETADAVERTASE